MKNWKYLLIFFIIVLLVFFASSTTKKDNNQVNTNKKNLYQEHVKERQKLKNMTEEEKDKYYQQKYERYKSK